MSCGCNGNSCDTGYSIRGYHGVSNSNDMTDIDGYPMTLGYLKENFNSLGEAEEWVADKRKAARLLEEAKKRAEYEAYLTNEVDTLTALIEGSAISEDLKNYLIPQIEIKHIIKPNGIYNGLAALDVIDRAHHSLERSYLQLDLGQKYPIVSEFKFGLSTEKKLKGFVQNLSVLIKLFPHTYKLEVQPLLATNVSFEAFCSNLRRIDEVIMVFIDANTLVSHYKMYAYPDDIATFCDKHKIARGHDKQWYNRYYSRGYILRYLEWHLTKKINKYTKQLEVNKGKSKFAQKFALTQDLLALCVTSVATIQKMRVEEEKDIDNTCKSILQTLKDMGGVSNILHDEIWVD